LATFSVVKYGDDHASILAHEWCRRMEHFFGIWMAQDDWLYLFSEGDLAAYAAKDEFVDFFLGLDADSATMVRAMEVNSLVPKEPRALA
jgi:hypothetical protein